MAFRTLLQPRYDRSVGATVEVATKTAISLPDSVFEEAEALAQQLGVSRSELYTKTLEAYLKKFDRTQILRKLNQVYSKESSDLLTRQLKSRQSE